MKGRINELWYLKKAVKQSIKDEERKLHKSFARKHSKLLLTLDICFILCLLFNIIAFSITEVLVQKKIYSDAKIVVDEQLSKGVQTSVDEYVIYHETNPDNQHLYSEIPEKIKPLAVSAWRYFLAVWYFWSASILLYIMSRRTLYSNLHLFFLIAFVTLLFVGTGYDALSNLILWITKVMFSA